jgi:predicted amidohydrolase YtcJ
MLIRAAGIQFGAVADLRIRDGLVAEIAPRLAAVGDEPVIEAGGDALLPSLNDHHLHLMSTAAAMASVACGPPQVRDAEGLAQALIAADAGASGWLRGIGFHESVMAGAGELDRHWLDRHGPARPLRIQHRSGRMWVFNSQALDLLGVRPDSDDPFERIDGQPSGRLYDADAWLRQRLRGNRPELGALSRQLAALGVTGLTDTTPTNTLADYRHFDAIQLRGELLQDLMVMGDESLDGAHDGARLRGGHAKFHLHEHDLPDIDWVVRQIRARHRAGRGVAFHCVTRTELVFVLGALAEAGSRPGDRIEHAGVTPPELMRTIAGMGLTVVTQPNFIRERGDAYRRDVDADDQPWLYRLRGFVDAGIPLAAGTDAPFGVPDPWAAMQAAVDRRAPDGAVMAATEALSPEAALGLFTGPLDDPGHAHPGIAPGQPADLCLIDRPWSAARQDLAAVRVRMTLLQGRIIAGHDAVIAASQQVV